MEAHQAYRLIKIMSTWTPEVGWILLHVVLCYISYYLSRFGVV